MVKSILHAEGLSINVLRWQYATSKGCDSSGLPFFKGARLRDIFITIESTQDITWWELAISDHRCISRMIIELQPAILGQQKTQYIYLYDCHIVKHSTNFAAYTNKPMTETFEVTAQGMEMSHSVGVYSTPFRKTFDKVKSKVYSTSIEEEHYEDKPVKADETKEEKLCSRLYFVAGAGNDLIGWDYTKRFKDIWTSLGISGFKKVDVPSGSNYMAKYAAPINDMLYITKNKDDVANRASNENLASSELQKPAHRRARNKIEQDLKSSPCLENEQLNLCGYSYGSAVVAQAAIQICDDGYTIDNLVLIGSPINDKSNLYKILLQYQSDGKICQIIRKDIEGDFFSNTKNSKDYIKGVFQNLSPQGEHFDLARPDNPKTPDIDEGKIADDEIKNLGLLLIQKGIK